MDNKAFELLEKLYHQFTEFKKETNTRFDKLENETKKTQICIENQIQPDIKMCLDELVIVKEKQFEHDDRFDGLEKVIEKHEVEIKVIKKYE